MSKYRCIYCGEPVEDSSCVCDACRAAIESSDEDTKDDRQEACDVRMRHRASARITEGFQILGGEE